MRRILSLLTLCLCAVAAAAQTPSQYVLFTANNITDLAGNKLASGTFTATPVLTPGSTTPAAPQLVGGGRGIAAPIIFNVTGGVLSASYGSAQLVDVTQANPANFCYSTQIHDNNTGNTWNQDACLQPAYTATGCTVTSGQTTCDYDNMVPTGVPGALQVAGPRGLNWRGAWSNVATYQIGDAVNYNGAAYINTVGANTATPPGTGWSLLAAEGASAITGLSGDGAGNATLTGQFNAATVAAGGAVSSGVPLPSGAPVGLYGLSPAAIAQTVLSHLSNRQYAAVVQPTTTVTAAVAAISGASITNRYLVYVPNGTYPGESIQCKDYVDIVGQSQSGVILTNTSQTGVDTMDCTQNSLVANLTIQNTVNNGDNHSYPIHADQICESQPTVTAFVNVTANSLGNFPSGFGAIGIGSRSCQTFYVVNSNGTGTNVNGILAHNAASQTAPTHVYLINDTGTSTNGCGFWWTNTGSTQPDWVQIVGGTYTGGASCPVPNEGIYAMNQGGSGEAYIGIDPSTIATVSIASGTGTQLAGIPLVGIPSSNYINGTLTVNGGVQGTTFGDLTNMKYFDFTQSGKITLDGADFYQSGTKRIVVPGASVLAGSFGNVASTCYFDVSSTAGQAIMNGCGLYTTGTYGLNSSSAVRGNTFGLLNNTAYLDFTQPGKIIATGANYDTTATHGYNVNGNKVLQAGFTGYTGAGAKISAPTQGTQALTGGTATVSTSAACAVGGSCHYQLTNCGSGGTVGQLSIGTIIAGTNFVINSSSATDTSNVCWQIN